ncbi:MAG: hypothetical protein HC804_13340, partial [Anaerolineae bacterium]|nr:hypothetical protein [Anaerolineae bacterium]
MGTDGRILLINPPGCAFLQLEETPDAWVGRRVQEVVDLLQAHAPQVAETIAAETKRVSVGDQRAGEGEFELPPQSIHWRNLPVLLDGQPLGRLIVLRDTTHEHTLEKMRDDLTHTMVHDLRGPLTAISISLEALQMMERAPNITPERRLQALERANSSTHKLLELVEAILELSRLESGHLELNYQPVSLAELVAGVLDAQMPLAREKQIEMACCVPERLPRPSLDRALVERVLQNLVHN